MQSVRSDSWRPAGASSNERGYTWAWRKARAEFLEANPLCVMCEGLGVIEPARIVDHKIPHRGDQAVFWDRSNWQGLCTNHHSSDKQRDENRDSAAESIEAGVARAR